MYVVQQGTNGLKLRLGWIGPLQYTAQNSFCKAPIHPRMIHLGDLSNPRYSFLYFKKNEEVYMETF